MARCFGHWPISGSGFSAAWREPRLGGWASAKRATCCPGLLAMSRRWTDCICAFCCRLPGAIFLLPLLMLLIGHRAPGFATEVGVLFAAAAFVLPWLAARASGERGTGLAVEAGALRVAALDALIRLAGGPGLRRRRPHAGRGAGQRSGLAGRPARHGRPHRDWRAASFLCAQVAVLAVLIDAGANPAAAIAIAFLVLAAFEAVGGLPRAGALAGHASAAARRVLEAADAPVPVPDPIDPAAMPAGTALRFEACRFPLAARPPAGVRGSDPGHPSRRPGCAAGAVGVRANRRWRRWR